MKKLLLLSALLIFACSTDSEGNPCIYEPTLETNAVTDITETSATLNGVISIVSENCDVPNNTEQGFVYSTEIQPTLDDTQVNVNGTNISTIIEGLTPNTTYYVRAFLTNNLGDFYGDEVSFTTEETLGCGSQTDYLSIVYGTQEWTIENACHTTYRDGTPIPQVTDDEEWANLTTGAWCYYDNDPNKGVLYNWFAVNDPRGLAPLGWHVPSDAEWATLEEHLIAIGYNYDGTTTGNKIAKSMASTTGWDSSTETGAIGNDQSLNNSSGFNAFPCDFREFGSLNDEELRAAFWSSSVPYVGFAYPIVAHCRFLFYDGSNLSEDFAYKDNGLSVRFVRD